MMLELAREFVTLVRMLELCQKAKSKFTAIFFFFFPCTCSPASGQAVVKGVVTSCPRFLPSNFIAHRVQQSHCSSIFHRVLLTHALALSASQFVHKPKSQRIYTSMQSAGLELTKLTYTRLEDNLIRHRGDRLTILCIRFCREFHVNKTCVEEVEIDRMCENRKVVKSGTGSGACSYSSKMYRTWFWLRVLIQQQKVSYMGYVVLFIGFTRFRHVGTFIFMSMSGRVLLV